MRTKSFSNSKLPRPPCLVVSCALALATFSAAPLWGQTQQLDFGDAPDPYPTRLSTNGARHIVIPSFFLGSAVDVEPDGQPNANATGDDDNPAALDDEDGVRFTTPLIPGQTAMVEVTATMSVGFIGRLDAWLDFNGNGSWAEPVDAIFIRVAINSGVNTLTFSVPATAVPGATYARFRLTREGFSRFDSLAPDGEVEDYRLTIGRPARCDESCKGTDFWLAFPGNYAPDPLNPVQLSLCILGAPGTTGTVSVAGIGFSQSFAIPGSMTALVLPPKAAELGDANDVIENKAIHVTASQPVGIHALDRVVHTTDGYTALPTSVLGTEYIVQAFDNVHTGIPPLNGSQFAIAASESNTMVTITPSVTTGVRDQGIPYTLTLHQGQTYQLRQTNDAPSDLSGTLITSDKPIAVFGSHRCASVRSQESFFCDYLLEQVLPVRNWGTEFVAALFATRSGGDTFRFLASADNTHVFVNGANVATLNRGKFHQMTLATPPYITADHPIFVTQYANSSDFDGVVNSDPFMVVVPATKLFSASQMVCTAPNGFPANYINVVAPTVVAGAVQLDGAGIGPFFTPIAGSGYSGARVPIAAGVHTVSSPAPLGVTVYGWGEYDSYGWPGCAFFGDITPPAVTCRSTDLTFVAGGGAAGGCLVQVPDLRSEATVSDNCTDPAGLVIQQTPAPGTMVGPGVHPITLRAMDPAGNVGSCIVTLTVIDPSPPAILCPSRVEANCNEGGQLHLRVPVYFDVSASTPCNPNLPVQCTPPSGSLFPLGTTTVNCVADNNGLLANCSFPVNVCFMTVGQPGAGRLELSWSTGGTLEHATVLTGPWTPVANATSPYQIIIGPALPPGFYRIRY